MVYCEPVKIGVPPVAAVYQLKVTPDWADVAVKTAVEPEQVCTGVDDTIGTEGVAVTLAVTNVRVGLAHDPALSAST